MYTLWIAGHEFGIFSHHFSHHFEKADFSNPERLRNTINTFVQQASDGHINDLLPPGSVSSNGNLVLVNAAYFKGAWQHPFENGGTKEKLFNGPTPENVDMMHVLNDFNHGACVTNSHQIHFEFISNSIEFYLISFFLDESKNWFLNCFTQQ